MVEWVGLSFPTLWANDTKHSQSNPSVPDRTDSNRESRETALLTKEMFLRTNSLPLLSTRNHSKKWSPSSSHPRGLFRSLASCDEVAGSSTIIQGVLTVATEPKHVSAQVVMRWRKLNRPSRNGFSVGLIASPAIKLELIREIPPICQTPFYETLEKEI